MAGPVVTALITAVVSLLLAIGKIAWDVREKRRDRRELARERLNRYRAPLLAAVDDLGRRLNNIRNDGFLAYLADDSRRDVACLGTLFRFAQYLAWAEIVHGSADRLRFESDESTRAVLDAMNDVGWTLAADEFDRTDPTDFTTSAYMLWREEQRAIGEMMQRPGDEPGCVSFATFADLYNERFSRWFARFAADLELPRSAEADRLANLQRVAARLARALDIDRTLVELDRSGNLVNPRWAQQAALGAPTRHTAPADRP